MSEQYFEENAGYFVNNQTQSDGDAGANKKNESAESEPYVKLSEQIYKTPRAYRRKIGYVAK
jgi:hypothetical protein